MDKGKKWKTSDKGKQWTTRSTTFDNNQELAALAIAVDEEKESEEVDICLSSTSHNIKSLSWHLDSAYSQHLTSEKNVFIDQITKSSAKIECANRDYLLAQGVEKIRLLCLKEDGSPSSTIIKMFYIFRKQKQIYYPWGNSTNKE